MKRGKYVYMAMVGLPIFCADSTSIGSHLHPTANCSKTKYIQRHIHIFLIYRTMLLGSTICHYTKWYRSIEKYHGDSIWNQAKCRQKIEILTSICPTSTTCDSQYCILAKLLQSS